MQERVMTAIANPATRAVLGKAARSDGEDVLKQYLPAGSQLRLPALASTCFNPNGRP
jgi:hypothetical protein